ncbi:Conserved_hypothetical protein [Hexamita inflata]|uniref:Uncharacterized protein n=1 Tax=Hexamita inflata TaxID=28002 RepID=A0AA86PJ04_9EUKA|nr:Conserved hypothetical protein [Hexamita inflata]
MNFFGGLKNNQNAQQPQRPPFGQANQNGEMHTFFQSSNQVSTQNQEKVTVVNSKTDQKPDGFLNSLNKMQQDRQQIENEKLKALNIAINEAVSQGYEPEVLDYQKYLGPDCSLETANSFMQSLKQESKQGQSILQQQYIQRYKSRVKDQKLTIGVDYYLSNIQFVDQLDVTNLLVSGLYAGGFTFNNQEKLSYILKFNHVPHIITDLNINKYHLKNLQGIQQMNQLLKLELSSNDIQDISALKSMTQITYLDLAINQISNIEALRDMVNLNTLRIGFNQIICVEPIINLNIPNLGINNNFIQDSQLLVNHPDISIKDIDTQKIPNIQQIQNYLGPSSTYDQAERLFNNINLNQITNKIQLHELFLIKHYTPLIKDFKLNIQNNNYITSLKFMEKFDIKSLFIKGDYFTRFKNERKHSKCSINFLFVPMNIVELHLTNSNLQSISGIQQMTQLKILNLRENQIYDIRCLQYLVQLTSLNLEDNCIMFIEPISKLNIPDLYLKGNMIQDTWLIVEHPKFQIEWITPYVQPQINDAKEFFGPEGTVNDAEDLLNQINQYKHYNTSTIENAQLKSLQNSVKDSTLKIENNKFIKSIQFADKLLLTTLIIQGQKSTHCFNEPTTQEYGLQFQNTPNSLIALHINKYLLQDITGIQQMVQLQILDLSQNSIENIQMLSELISLTQLNLSFNKISDTSAISSLINLNTLNLSHNKLYDISGINNLTNLSTLLLNNNCIKNILGIPSSQYLLQLDLSRNKLINLQDLVGIRLNSLRILNLSSNNLEDVSQLSNFISIVELNLENNKLQHVHYLQTLINLLNLNISSNELVDISFVYNMKQLVDLNLSKNRIICVKALSNLEMVKSLDIAGNEVIHCNSLLNLSNLQVVELRGNFITETQIQYVINQKQRTPNIKQINISNRIESISQSNLNLYSIKSHFKNTQCNLKNMKQHTLDNLQIAIQCQQHLFETFIQQMTQLNLMQQSQ